MTLKFFCFHFLLLIPSLHLNPFFNIWPLTKKPKTFCVKSSRNFVTHFLCIMLSSYIQQYISLFLFLSSLSVSCLHLSLDHCFMNRFTLTLVHIRVQRLFSLKVVGQRSDTNGMRVKFSPLSPPPPLPTLYAVMIKLDYLSVPIFIILFKNFKNYILIHPFLASYFLFS